MSMFPFLLLSLFLLSNATGTLLRTKEDINTDAISEYLTSNADYLKSTAELAINQVRNQRGRIGPISMPSILLGGIVGDFHLPPTSPAPGRLEVKVMFSVVDPTAGSEDSEENKDASTTVELLVPVDIGADRSLMIDVPNMHVTTAYFAGKPQLLVEMNSGAQDAPRFMEVEESQGVVDRLVEHVNKWRTDQCSNVPALTGCGVLQDIAVLGWVVDAGPGQEAFVTAVNCGGVRFVGGLDLPRSGTIETALFAGTIPMPCAIGIHETPAHLLPSPAATTFVEIISSLRATDISPAEKQNNDQIKARIQGDRDAFLAKARFSRVPLANGETEFDKDTVQMMLPQSFDPRIDDHSGFPSSSTTCYQAPNRIRNQRSCMSCWAFASASVFTDRQCLAVLKEHLSNHPDGNGAPPPLLYSPASALACRKPPTCLLGGFTNFVSMLSSGIASETCFPYVLKTDGEARYHAATGEMYSDADVVPKCPIAEHGGNGKCPGDSTAEYITEDVSDYGVYRIHNNPDALRKAIFDGGPVTAAISWSGEEG
jgi:hypothetical protein